MANRCTCLQRDVTSLCLAPVREVELAVEADWCRSQAEGAKRRLWSVLTEPSFAHRAARLVPPWSPRGGGESGSTHVALRESSHS